MKFLRKNTVNAALGLSAGACTVVTDPSSGSSASSGGSSSTAFMNRQEQTAEFAKVNLERLRNDMAAGRGEYLASLATLLNIESGQQPAFFAFTQDKFAVLFPTDRTTAADMLATLDRELQADPRFSQRLTLN